jgi:hypothetical protein
MKHLETKIKILELYFRQAGIESECISPNLVADIALDYFQFDLTSKEVVYISETL